MSIMCLFRALSYGLLVQNPNRNFQVKLKPLFAEAQTFGRPNNRADQNKSTMRARLKELIHQHQCLAKHEIRQYNADQSFMSNAFVINMASRTDRMKEAEKTLAKLGIEWFRFSAIVGKLITDPYILNKFNVLRPGELGCLLSHLIILYLASEHPNQDGFTLVVEDDIVSSSGHDAWKTALVQCRQIYNQDGIDMIYFGKCLERCSDMIHVKDNIYRAVAPSCTHAYGIRNAYAKKILIDLDVSHKYPDSRLNEAYFNRGIDSIYGDYIVYGIAKALVFHPAIFYQDVLEGGSDLRKEFLINYQECNDTNPCKPQEEKVVVVKKRRMIDTVIIIILLIIILAVLIAWLTKHRTRARSFMRGTGGTIVLGSGLGLLLLAILIFLVIFLVKMMKKEQPMPKWLEGFPRAENAIRPTLVKYCRATNRFPIDQTYMATKQYEIFNPNGLYYSDRRKFHKEWLNSKTVFISASRCSNGKNSYPLLRIFNAELDQLYESRMIFIESHKSITNTNLNGYEDMRIFIYKNKPYMIGVNIDQNPSNLPSMFLVKLDWNFNTVETWRLKYEPVINYPNKNWAPLTLPGGELGFIVDIDPLLIVSRRIKGSKDKASRSEKLGKKVHQIYGEDCEVYIQCPKQLQIDKIRNSTIVYRVAELPHCWRSLFQDVCDTNGNCERYVLLGHTKFVETDFIETGTVILYQHYFVIIDISTARDGVRTAKIWTSKSFHVEQAERPHIEYISGFGFRDDEMVITYGLTDSVDKYQRFDVNGVRSILTI